ncbi:uncharacterized protein [Coffea arabica]|uniref:Uncharacterized protein isoform X2 n=1 Tax=Coffea arabica TaxID=13443 RepID=A0ABM4UH66_COFAR
MASTDALAHSTNKNIVRNRRLREKYASLSVEEKEARRAKQREAYQKRRGRKAAASTSSMNQRQTDGSSSKNSSNYKCRRINKLNVSGDPPICDSCSNFLHETVDNLAGISMTVQPQPVETNVSNVIKNHPKVKMYIKMRTLMRLRGNYLHYWPQRFKDAFLLEVFVLKPTSTDCSSPSLIF